MEIIILAGGFGSRLQSVVSDVPKPMADINGIPFLQYMLDFAIDNGASKFILAVGYKYEIIIKYFGDSYKNIPIQYSIEDEPLLTGGAIKKSLKLCNDEFIIVLNGDTFFDVKLKDFYDFSIHKDKKIAISVKNMTNFSRYGIVHLEDDYIVNIENARLCSEGFINGGTYVLKKNCLDTYPNKFSIESISFHDFSLQKEIIAFKCDGFFIDIGVPDDYRNAIDILGS